LHASCFDRDTYVAPADVPFAIKITNSAWTMSGQPVPATVLISPSSEPARAPVPRRPGRPTPRQGQCDPYGRAITCSNSARAGATKALPLSFGRRCPAISHAASPSARIVKLDFRPVRDRDYRTNPAPNYRRQCQIDVPPIKADKSQCYACWQHPLPPGRSSPTPANPRSAESIASLIATLMSLMRPACQCTIDIDSHQHSSPEQRRQGQETKGRS
jgi:hypothetical protein